VAINRTSFVDTIVPSERISLPALAARLGVHPATVFRWVRRGVRGVRLQTVRIGGQTVVTPENLATFLEELNRHKVVRGGTVVEGGSRD
jgi:transposase